MIKSNALVGTSIVACPRKLETAPPRFPRKVRWVQAVLSAVLFDCDGVLAETERDAHRVAFNLAFAEKVVDTVWDVELYGKLLETGGGKERMTVHWNEVGWPGGYSDSESRAALVKTLHARKTELFMDLVQRGEVPLRDGVKRLIQEVTSAGVPVAVCSTSNERAVAEIVAQLGADFVKSIPIFAGDVVSRKKPRCVVVSRRIFIGLQRKSAARGVVVFHRKGFAMSKRESSDPLSL
jgi:beta-phosphoglucomutase-like phosphatase (HAD superfamily)